MPETSHEARLANAERDLQSHAKTITVFTEELSHYKARVEGLEQWRHSQNIVDAREDERDKALYRRLDAIEDSIKSVRDEGKENTDSITGFGWKIFWLVAATCVGVFVTFILKGGLFQ